MYSAVARNDSVGLCFCQSSYILRQIFCTNPIIGVDGTEVFSAGCGSRRVQRAAMAAIFLHEQTKCIRTLVYKAFHYFLRTICRAITDNKNFNTAKYICMKEGTQTGF